MLTLKDFHYELPEELIAQKPSPQRQDARLLVVRRFPQRGQNRYEDLHIRDLPTFAANEPSLQNALWVRNTSRVFPARFYAKKRTGARHEVVLLEPLGGSRWKALLRGEASFKYPQILYFEKKPELSFMVTGPREVDFAEVPVPLFGLLEEVGEMPLPPYIRDRDPLRDKDRYQPIWADPQKTGSAAAPTASLHFTSEILNQMKEQKQRFCDVVLHVGLGTFEPLRQEQIEKNELHSESFEVSLETQQQLQQQLAEKKPIVSLGTTALRTLESLSLTKTPQQVLSGRTHIFIQPGFQFRYSSALFTNFHLPESSLLILVSAFCQDHKMALEAYQYAIQKKYRFFSYGDASLWL